MKAPVSASLGAMGSLLEKLDLDPEDDLGRTRRLPKGVKNGMHILKEDLEEIGTYLHDLLEVDDPPLTAKSWMKEVRELSYDIEDYIDRFAQPGHSATFKARSICKISHVEISGFPKKKKKKLKRRKGMADMISEFGIRAQEVIERHERYELGCRKLRRRFAPIGPMLPTPYEEGADLVIDGWTSEFIEKLANDGDEQLKVVSVVGSGGIGKTTLARVLYNKLRGQFDCRAFVKMNQNPDIKIVVHDMLTQLQRNQAHDDCHDLDHISKIREYLQDKRYLIIVDDLWAAPVWDIINNGFPEGSRRSRIIITTQIYDVALACCCYHPEHVFEMKPLDVDHSRKLFFNRFVYSESDCPKKFKEISYKIVEKCGGFPLATINMASLLASQPVVMEQWTYICDLLSTGSSTNSTSEGTRSVINLSYNNLTHYLKTCLLYLNMYPEGCTICKDDLVKQWVAEGFIGAAEGRDMEKVAESYFDELVGRRFLQPARIKYNNEVVSCTVHDMVRDLIAYESAEENFIMVVDYYRMNVELSNMVHRLSIHFGEAKYAKTPGNIRTSQVRSLTFFGLFKCMPSISEFKLLCILNLKLSGHNGEETFDLSGISELFQLRYFKVASDVCIELPKHMQGLQNLETLDIDTKVTDVPWDIIHLPCLLHLRLPFEKNLMDGIGSVRPANVQSLGKLTNLQDLRLTCSTPPPDHLERNVEALEALGSLLGGLGNLKTLALVCDSSHRNAVVHCPSEAIVSWDGITAALLLLLQRFEWSPCRGSFSRVPKWIGELHNLCILKIAVRELLMDGVDVLRGLPALTALSLYVQTAPVERIVFGKAGFSVLKYFKFRCSLPRLKFEEDAMPKLRKLKLVFNAHSADQNDSTPISIEHLSCLKEISAKIGAAGADPESALTAAVINHPSNPIINVQSVDWILCGDEGTKDEDSREVEKKQAASRISTLSESSSHLPVGGTQDEDSSEVEKKQTDSWISTLSESSSHLPVGGSCFLQPMEGVMVSAFSGAMNSLLAKLATLLGKDYKLLRSVRKDITSLRGEMRSMNALLVKLSEMEEHDEQDKEWRDKVRELAYDMEDCVDIFMNDLDHGGAKAWFAWRRLKTLKTHYKIANRIKDLKARAVEVRECRDRYQFDEHNIVPPRAVAIDPRLLALHAEAASLVGVDDPKEELIKLLTKEEEGIQRLQVISIVGFGGIGKTTLASQVYTTIKGRYDCTALVSVSRNPDMAQILTDILSGVGCWAYSDNDVGQLIDRLKEYLKDKRYLIVIDDIWTAEAWKIIECCFVENNRGGRIITTTRYENVAKECCSRFHGHVYQIKPLSDRDSRRLFHRRVFDSEDACPEQLNKVSNEIVQKCAGVPLAILCVASILSSRQEVMSKESWEIIKNYLGSQLKRNPRPTLESEWMRHVLNLSYNDLSQDLKSCMLYLGIFPEDYEIMKDDLMRRWIAEGFVCEKYTRGQEEVAESYFNELINRSMIQIARLDDCGEVMSCRVHDLMFDFIISKSTEENFITVINDQYSSKGSLEVRRLSLQVRNSERNQMLANMALTQARSFNFWGSAQGMPSLSKFRLLRVLHLDVYDSEDEQYDLSYIRGLFQLRYLRIGGIRSKKTLTQLQKLQHLKTLEIVDDQMDYLRLDLRELPSTLLHLIVPATVKLLGGIGRMRALRTLQVQLEGEENIKGLGELANLRELKLVRCSEESYGFLLSSLCKLGICNLRSLTICGGFRDNDIDDALSCWSPPPRNLGRLHVLPCPFSIVPDWITQLDKLSSLEVQILSLTRDGTKVLARLPFLVHLRLHVENVPEEGVVICGTWFRNLKEFWFRCKVLCLTFEAGAMPGLQSLEIECNARGGRQADDVLAGIEHLGSLKLFKVHIYESARSEYMSQGSDSSGGPQYLVGSPSMEYMSEGDLEVNASMGLEMSEGDLEVNASMGLEMSEGDLEVNASMGLYCSPPRPHVEELPRWDRNSLEAALRKAINKHPNVSSIIGY